MKIFLIQAITKEIESYVDIFVPHNSRYAIRNGYHYFVYNEKSEEFRNHPSWLKIECFKHIKWQEYDYIWVLDADCLINDWSIKLEDVISKEPREIIMSENGLNGGRPLNAGSFILKKTIIPTLLEKYKDFEQTGSRFLKQKMWEQEMFNDWYEKEPNLFSKRHMDEINSYFQSCFSKREALEELIRNVCSFLSKKTDGNISIDIDNFDSSLEEIKKVQSSNAIVLSHLYILDFIMKNINEIYAENINSVLFNELYNTHFRKTDDINLKIKTFKSKQFVHHMMGMSDKDRLQKAKRIITQNNFN